MFNAGIDFVLETHPTALQLIYNLKELVITYVTSMGK